MSFRRRNIGLSASTNKDQHDQSSKAPLSAAPGVRPSPIDGRPTTSTGTASLDSLLAGHAGLPLGTSLLVEENGTTDYAGALLRYFAAEGLVQGHHVHVVGLREKWGRELPGLVSSEKEEKSQRAEDRMKIAWRYESLGQFEAGVSSSRDPVHSRTGISDAGQARSQPFCHVFDLTKKLEHPPDANISFLKVSPHPERSPFSPILEQLHTILADSPNTSIHRLVVPGLLSPQIYPPHSSLPHNVLPFLQGVRVLLAAYPARLAAVITLPLSLFPRSLGLVRWMELLSDGVIELTPFPHSSDQDRAAPKPPPGESATYEEPPQGLLNVHRLPIFHERGGGSSAVGEDWVFTLSRRKFTIKPYSLPPIEGDTEAQQTHPAGQQPKKSDMEF
ncbi:hypothetical protein EPUS_01950 [Endocarpon pusillum Z07020]|uniref:Elongator complex protein 4 n=1 Tax=Endocarpon pusillum (strain Z07020 / HMAS-L-300199) TaxID=1263415 RepID=U1GPM5_ENDPU|nr:uncharacterized protein EPUS_01950 [Endocarpon pusillum Z07020]ERF74263.1 hypothetical protein EPUS_01950 [Endocarpon pusillum Z07020]